jgi:hypothetical protein
MLYLVSKLYFLYFLYQLIAVKDFLCVRGYWDTPEEASKAAIIDQFSNQIQQAGLLGLRGTLYFPRYTGKFLLFIFLPIRIIHHLQKACENF